jgi:ABC-type transport system involved in cytochrome bd biosynthesis fused ATPase/permease subunit
VPLAWGLAEARTGLLAVLPAAAVVAALRAAAGAAWEADVPPSALDARIARALELADARGVLAALPDGLDSLVGPGGRVLSAGQTQRLALAGALASTAPLVLLDEPTAHLDAASAVRAGEGILRACAGRTLVVATHDHGLAARCDVVVDLDRSRRGSEPARPAIGAVR